MQIQSTQPQHRPQPPVDPQQPQNVSVDFGSFCLEASWDPPEPIEGCKYLMYELIARQGRKDREKVI